MITACTLSRAIEGFPADLQLVEQAIAATPAGEPIAMAPCACEPGCPKPSERQGVYFLRTHPRCAELVDQLLPT